jgi:hypothetical protein
MIRILCKNQINYIEVREPLIYTQNDFLYIERGECPHTTQSNAGISLNCCVSINSKLVFNNTELRFYLNIKAIFK